MISCTDDATERAYFRRKDLKAALVGAGCTMNNVRFSDFAV